MIAFALAVPTIGVLHNRLSATVRATHTSFCSISSSVIVITTNLFPMSSVLSVFSSCTTGLGNGGELNGTVSFTVEMTPFMNSSIDDLQMRKGASKLQTIPDMTRIPNSAIWTRVVIV